MRIPISFRVVPAALAAACATNPATGGRMISLVSEGQEVQMGQQADPSIVAEMGLVDDTALQRYVADLGLRLARISERPNLPWTFRVLDDPVVNAFALPGGFIYLTRGILANFQSEAELAAVLGHEIGHVTARHSVSQISKQQLAGLGLAVGTILSPTVAQYADIAGQGLGLLFLKFSRDDESQADQLGLRYMRRAGYDPRQMPEVYKMLDRVSQASGSRVPGWLSTHPNPVDRQERIARTVTALPPESLGTAINRAQYLQRIDGIVYGPNPRNGFFRESQFYHPDLKFQLTFPAGWKTFNQAQSAGAVSPPQDVLVELSGAGRGTSPDSAARAFFANQSVTGQSARGTVHGFPAQTGAFTAQAQQGALGGYVAFIAYDGLVYRLLGYGTQTAWRSQASAVRTAIHSFDRLTDPLYLAVEPWRVDIVRTDRDLTAAEFAQRYPGPVAPAALALINGVDANGTIPRGQAKRVLGKPLP